MHQQAESGRNRQSNFYFNGDTIYSYGGHFPIAKLVKRKGKKAVLFTTRDYSPSTAKHKHMTRMAIPASIPTFMVPDVNANSQQIRAWYKEECNRKLVASGKCKFGRRMNDLLAEVSRMIREFNDYSDFFSLTYRMKEPQNWEEVWAKSVELRDAYEAKAAEREQRKKERAAAALELAKKKFEELLPKWKTEGLATTILPWNETIHLRLKNRKLVETSRGAIVPLSGVKILWELIKTARSEQRAIESVTIDTKNPNDDFKYPVNRINTDGSVHAGCHHIKWPEIEEFAIRLGWL